MTLDTFVRDLSLSEWIKLFGTVFDRESRKASRFSLWPKQKELCDFLDENDNCLLPKARQIGISEVAAERAMKSLISYPKATILVLSKTERDAEYFLEYRVKEKFNALPKISGIKWPEIKQSSNKKLTLSNGSSIISLPASNSAGAGMTVDGIIIDEAGGIDLQHGVSLAEIYMRIKPTMEESPYGWMMTLGTSEPGSVFNEWVKEARDGERDTPMFFLPANARPERTEEWMELEKKDFPSIADFKTQYPMTIDDFFAVREGLIFPHFESEPGGVHCHTCEVHAGWTVYYAYDHGFRHPAVFIRVVHDPRTDLMYVTDEWYWHDTRIEIIAPKIAEIVRSMKPSPYKMIADTAIFNRTGQTPISDVFAEQGIFFEKSNKHKGLSMADGSLGLLSKRFTENSISINPACTQLINELATWRWNSKRKGDNPVDVGDDGIDCLRYLCAEMDDTETKKVKQVYQPYTGEKKQQTTGRRVYRRTVQKRVKKVGWMGG